MKKFLVLVLAMAMALITRRCTPPTGQPTLNTALIPRSMTLWFATTSKMRASWTVSSLKAGRSAMTPAAIPSICVTALPSTTARR